MTSIDFNEFRVERDKVLSDYLYFIDEDGSEKAIVLPPKVADMIELALERAKGESRMDVLRSATCAEIEAITWDDKTQDKPMIAQMRDNLKDWKETAEDYHQALHRRAIPTTPETNTAGGLI